jgi:hypothetical protein
MACPNGAGPALCDDRGEARRVDRLGGPINSPHSPAISSKQDVRAELARDDTCTALGIIAHANAPVLALCRRLIEAGHDPARPLEAYRGATLCLRVRSIGEAACLTVKDDNRGTPRFAAYRPGPAEGGDGASGEASPARFTDRPATGGVS